MTQGMPDVQDVAGLLARMEQTLSDVDKLLADLPDNVGRASTVTSAPGEATDASGSIRVVLAPDWLPKSIEVGPEWRRRVGCEGFAGAVTDACLFAAATLHAATAPPQADGPHRDGRPGQHGPSAAPDVTNILMRPLEDVLTDLAAATLGPDAHPTPPTPAGGPPANGRLALSVSLLGTVRCAANPDWVNRQEHQDLNHALAAAVADIRANLPGRTQPPSAGR
jgi:hypothetical protein